MSFYVKLKESKDAKRFRFVTVDNETTGRRAKALAFYSRDVALRAAARQLEERPACEARVVNENGRLRNRTVTESHPGVDAIACAVGLPHDVVLALAKVPGCPVVEGGRGRRFASVEAFKGFLAGLTQEQRLLVPAYAVEIKQKLVLEIAGLCWGASDAEAARMRRMPYDELVALRDEWKRRDAEDKQRAEEQRRALIEQAPG